MKYIEIRCPNSPYSKVGDKPKIDKPELTCDALLGALPEKSPLHKFIIRCPHCKIFWEISKTGNQVKYKHIKKNINMLPMTDAYDLVFVDGGKYKDGK